MTYCILCAPVGRDPHWEVVCEGYSSVEEACESLAGIIKIDIITGEQCAYRIVEQEEK